MKNYAIRFSIYLMISFPVYFLIRYAIMGSEALAYKSYWFGWFSGTILFVLYDIVMDWGKE